MVDNSFINIVVTDNSLVTYNKVQHIALYHQNYALW